MEKLSDGDRVRVIGPSDNVWLEDEGTVVGFEKGDSEWAVIVELDENGRRFFSSNSWRRSTSHAPPTAAVHVHAPATHPSAWHAQEKVLFSTP